MAVFSKEIERNCAAEIITRVEEIEEGSEVGLIAAQDIIDIVIQNLGPDIYNMGLQDANKLLQERLADPETKNSMLEQTP